MQHETPARMDRPEGSPPDGAVSTRQSKIHHPHLGNALVLNYAQMFREAGFLTRIEPQNEFTHIDGSAKRLDLHCKSTISAEAKHVSTSRSPIQRCCTRAPTLSERQARLQTCNREQHKYSNTGKLRGQQGRLSTLSCTKRTGGLATQLEKFSRFACRRLLLHSGGNRWRVSSIIGARGFPWSFKSLRLERSHERFRDSLLAHNVGSDESSRLNYRGIAWAR